MELAGPEKQKRKRSAGSGASAFVGGIATNEITTFLVEAEAEAALKSKNPHPCLIDSEGKTC